MGTIRSAVLLVLLLHVSSLGVHASGLLGGVKAPPKAEVGQDDKTASKGPLPKDSTLAQVTEEKGDTGLAKKNVKTQGPAEETVVTVDKAPKTNTGVLVKGEAAEGTMQKEPAGKTKDVSDEIVAEDTKPQAGEKGKKGGESGSAGKEVKDAPNKDVAPAGAEGSEKKSVTTKADEKSDVPKADASTATDGKPATTAGLDVPPVPVVTKSKPESATAISSTIPAVLIYSVVFLYLSHVGH